jgi:hypothetical protein
LTLEFPGAGNLAGKFFAFAAHSALRSVDSHRNSNALHAKSRISSPIGAGNFPSPGQGI